MKMSNQKKTSIKRMSLYCEPCGTKKIIEIEELVIEKTDPRLATGQVKIKNMDEAEIKSSPIQLKIPVLDPETKKTVESKFQPQPTKYKCPKCGRAVKLRELGIVHKPLADALQRTAEEKERQRLEEDKKKRLEDGKPPEKKMDPEFLG